MIGPPSRRHLWKHATAAALVVTALPPPSPAADTTAHPHDLIRETVTAAHGNFKRVKEIIDARPALANAAIDWGFGDWEDALGAASHVGHREIAEYLISHGARPTLFSAAMLGHLDTVKAILAAHPGAQRIPGPHSISLLAHARAGGKPAESVFRYLESLGDAGAPQRPPLSPEDAAALTGEYEHGIQIAAKGTQLTFRRQDSAARGLVHLGGGHEFHPVGAAAVRIRFVKSGATLTLTVYDPEPVLTARRVS